jgi:GH43 family beta-xylosidase
LTNKVEHLEPINFEEMKQQFINQFSNKYIDKGVEGLAQFICEIPCFNKFITTDYGRKTISFKLSEPKNQLVNDPKASILLNNTIKQNADTIIDKAEDRYQYFLSQIAEAREEDLEPDQSDVDKKNKTRELKTIAQNAKNNITLDSIERNGKQSYCKCH